MPIPVTCRCGKNYTFRDEYAGRRAKCPTCGQVVVVPTVHGRGAVQAQTPQPESSRDRPRRGKRRTEVIFPFIVKHPNISMLIGAVLFVALYLLWNFSSFLYGCYVDKYELKPVRFAFEKELEARYAPLCAQYDPDIPGHYIVSSPDDPCWYPTAYEGKLVFVRGGWDQAGKRTFSLLFYRGYNGSEADSVRRSNSDAMAHSPEEAEVLALLTWIRDEGSSRSKDSDLPSLGTVTVIHIPTGRLIGRIHVSNHGSELILPRPGVNYRGEGEGLIASRRTDEPVTYEQILTAALEVSKFRELRRQSP